MPIIEFKLIFSVICHPQDSVDTVEELLRLQEDFEKMLAAQEEKFSSLGRETKVEESQRRKREEEERKRREAEERRKEEQRRREEERRRKEEEQRRELERQRQREEEVKVALISGCSCIQ